MCVCLFVCLSVYTCAQVNLLKSIMDRMRGAVLSKKMLSPMILVL